MEKKAMIAEMVKQFFILSILSVSFNFPISLTAATWYVDAKDGNDTFSGLSPNFAWQSLKKVNSTIFQPGDTILLKTGSCWTGQLAPQGIGEKGRPIVIDKYGLDSLPVINGNGMTGEGVVRLYNQSFWEIHNLEITNNAIQQGDRRGVEIKASNYGLVQHIYLKNLHIHHIKGLEGHGNTQKRTAGIYIATVSDVNTPTRFDDIMVEGCEIHHIYNQGIVTNNEAGLGDYPGTGSFHDKKFTNLRIRKNTADPLFSDPGSGGFGIHSVSGYKLQPESPCINAGLLVSNNGGRDYWGNDITDRRPDIGAFEFSKSTIEIND